ncbi:uncharacterized protein BO96DRAFT_39252 [Aspergillus niger CBS 101883]|uniref:Uncharacterized protein n=1 Tax=Aspergillus niger ATCC 13496 TaxID=1353008 RepID=A0A370BMW4_ASPNG|nr:uncharacterized protein BO96DRAFT_39252 [Aspergillus niger CBS 101883]PYH57456.1 hypothetical protein BO96DRAFT_39252 [Aspergillus niger CBS 101883]RDH16827.1 hypothetical protein M747DRAFT_107734 [Aspergillus niger ATCC 13496]
MKSTSLIVSYIVMLWAIKGRHGIFRHCETRVFVTESMDRELGLVVDFPSKVREISGAIHRIVLKQRCSTRCR